MEEIRPGVYRHFKGGEYRVLCMARHSETEEWMVVYQALYGERGIWVRPAAMWSEEVERGGERIKRFTFIGERTDHETARCFVQVGEKTGEISNNTWN